MKKIALVLGVSLAMSTGFAVASRADTPAEIPINAGYRARLALPDKKSFVNLAGGVTH